MSEMRQEPPVTQQPAPSVPRQAGRHVARGPAPEQRVTGWVGWVFFGAVMMLLAGAFQAVAGLTALLSPDYYVVGTDGLLVGASWTAWGWVHLGLGVLAVAAGLAVLAGQLWGQLVGIAMGVVSAVVNLAFLKAYPVWSLLVIAVDVLVVYAFAVHGREVRAVR